MKRAALVLGMTLMMALVITSAAAAQETAPPAPPAPPAVQESPSDAPRAPAGEGRFAPGPKQSPAQSPMQSPVQKGPVQKGGYTAGMDSGYRSFSYEPNGYGAYDSYGYYDDGYYGYSRSMSRRAPAWRDITAKATGRY
jgi:hypothetical protein